MATCWFHLAGIISGGATSADYFRAIWQQSLIMFTKSVEDICGSVTVMNT